jgi:hypothetical protein
MQRTEKRYFHEDSMRRSTPHPPPQRALRCVNLLLATPPQRSPQRGPNGNTDAYSQCQVMERDPEGSPNGDPQPNPQAHPASYVGVTWLLIIARHDPAPLIQRDSTPPPHAPKIRAWQLRCFRLASRLRNGHTERAAGALDWRWSCACGGAVRQRRRSHRRLGSPVERPGCWRAHVPTRRSATETSPRPALDQPGRGSQTRQAPGRV